MRGLRVLCTCLILWAISTSVFAQGEIRRPAERPRDASCDADTVPTRTALGGQILSCDDGTVYGGKADGTWTALGSGSGPSLSGDNTWTGGNTFSGHPVTVDSQALRVAVSAPPAVDLSAGDAGSVTNGEHQVWVAWSKTGTQGSGAADETQPTMASITISGNEAILIDPSNLGGWSFHAPYLMVYITKAGETGAANAHFYNYIEVTFTEPLAFDAADASLTGGPPIGTGTFGAYYFGNSLAEGGLGVFDIYQGAGVVSLIQPALLGDGSAATRISNLSHDYLDFFVGRLVPSTTFHLGSATAPFGTGFFTGIDTVNDADIHGNAVVDGYVDASDVSITSATGTGTQFACFDTNGKLVRSATACGS